MFFRNSDGTYSFGTRKITLRLEKDHLKVRVGGSYLSIEEFIDQNLPTERAKIDRRDSRPIFLTKQTDHSR